MLLLLQIIVLLCFVGLVVVLFIEKLDYLMFAFIFIIISGVATAIILPFVEAELPIGVDHTLNPSSIEFYVEAIDWEVISFLIAMFIIVEILNERKIFHEVSRRIIVKFKDQIRLMFYFICIVSTLSASILEDLSVAIIFGPIIVLMCISLSINPTPFLLGMTVCINLASTLTPFGSAENVLIANRLNLTFKDFFLNFSVYFVIATILTLVLLDVFILRKYLKTEWEPRCEEQGIDTNNLVVKESVEIPQKDLNTIFYKRSTKLESSLKKQIDNRTFFLNLGAIVVFLVLLIVIPSIWLPTFISLVIFILINPVKTNRSLKARPNLSFYLRRVDFKLVFFFICLFVLVHLMEANGTIFYIETLLENVSQSNVFVLSITILILTSVFSAFLDNAPVTIIFLPIIEILLGLENYAGLGTPIIIAFVLGINLGGNFLPQGSAPDLMTLEIAREYCVDDLNYKKLFKVGGLFALLHVVIGIVYIVFFVYVL
jgi:Na+/H+ antiporter NhaD/arsenite permease-like protein